MELHIQLSFKQRACTKLSSWRLGHLGNPTVGLARLVNWSRDPELGYSRSRNATRYAALGLNKRGVHFTSRMQETGMKLLWRIVRIMKGNHKRLTDDHAVTALSTFA